MEVTNWVQDALTQWYSEADVLDHIVLMVVGVGLIVIAVVALFATSEGGRLRPDVQVGPATLPMHHVPGERHMVAERDLKGDAFQRRIETMNPERREKETGGS
nr:hypothetical protein [uncultured Celeribacter sp.]